jgi:hypothetical protein
MVVALVRHRQTLYVAPGQTLNNPSQVTDDASEGEKGLFYPGLVNISGTYCFMNSTMQVGPSHPDLFRWIPNHTTPRAP